MYSRDRKLVLVQNGEIYNYIELRDELRNAGARFELLAILKCYSGPMNSGDQILLTV